jgi:hypothetical protein
MRFGAFYSFSSSSFKPPLLFCAGSQSFGDDDDSMM